jgi:hypothetical protein
MAGSRGEWTGWKPFSTNGATTQRRVQTPPDKGIGYATMTPQRTRLVAIAIG